MTTPTSPEPARTSDRAKSRWFRARNEVIWLFLIALLVRGVAAWMNPAILNDSVSLLGAAERARREGLGAALGGPDHPLAPWLVALVPAGFDPETAATALSVLAGAFAIWPLHVLARRACGRHAATAACIVYAALPKAVGVASVPLTSAVLLPLLLSGLSVAVAAGVPSTNRRRIVRLVSAGLLCGAAYLCRPEGLLAAAGAVLAALWLARRGRRLASAAIVLAGFLAVAVPYAYALSRDADRLVLTPKKDIARFIGAGGAPLDAGEPPEAAQETASALEGALTAPIILLVLAGAFLPGRWRHPRSIAARAILVLVAGAGIALVVRLNSGWGYGGARHILPGALLLLPFAGEGFMFVGVFISRVIARRRLAVVLSAFVAIPCAVKAVLRPEGADQADARALGEAIAAGAGPRGATGVVVASFREPLVAYYAGRALRPAGGSATDVRLWGRFGALLAAGTSEAERSRLGGELAETLRAQGAQWLVVDLFRSQTTPSGAEFVAGRLLAERLTNEGVLAGPVTAAGSQLAAFPVK